MHGHNGIIIVITFHFLHFFTHLIVVSNQRVYFLRIGKRQFAAEIGITRKQICKGISAIIAGEHYVYHGFRIGHNIGYQTRSPFIKDYHHRLACCLHGFHQSKLVGRDVQVGKVARSFAIGVFTDTCHNIIHICGCRNGLFYFRLVFLPISAILLVGDAGLITHVTDTEFLLHSFKNRVVTRSKTVGKITLPAITPASVKATHAIGVRSRHKYFLAFRNGKGVICVF